MVNLSVMKLTDCSYFPQYCLLGVIVPAAVT